MENVPELPVYGFDPNSPSGLISVVIAVLLPLLVGLITRRSTTPGFKAVLLLGAAAIKSALEAWLVAINTAVDVAWLPVVFSVLLNFGIAVAVHFGLWSPTGATDAVQDAGVKDPKWRGSPAR